MKKLVLCLFAVLTAATSYAKPTAADIAAAMPGMPPAVSIETTPMKGIYEVTTDTSVFFVDDSLTHLIGGEMYDVKTKQSITKASIEKVRARMAAQQTEREKALIKGLDLKDALVEKKGTGLRTLYVFTDPLCPYCKRLEASLEKITDVTIYRFFLAFKGPVAVDTVTNVWCSSDQLAAWKDVIAGKELLTQKCATPLDRTAKLVPLLGIKGTPTLFKSNGTRKDGAVSKEVLDAWLAE